MRRIWVYGLIAVVIFLSGCIMRVIPHQVDRVDQGLTGNRGVITGEVPASTEEPKAKTRTIYELEIELPSPADREDKEIEGNRGYIYGEGKEVSAIQKTPVKRRSSIVRLGGGIPAIPQVVYKPAAIPETKYKKEQGEGVIVEKRAAQRIYEVQKGDTLQKISKKMYGTTKKWKKIYEANRATLKNPDLIKPGQRLVIPLD